MILVNWFRAKVHLSHVLILSLFVVGGLAMGLVFWVNHSRAGSSPEAVVQQYLAGLYAQEYERTYTLISTVDRAYKSRDEYLRENKSFTGYTLEAARQLASYIEYPEIQTEQRGDRATVTVKFISPDGNAEVVRDILFVSQGDELPEAERKMLLDKLDRLHEGGQIPSVEGEQIFELVKEADGWHIFENWAEAVRVHFSAEVKQGLPWEFEPVQATILAKPGETLQNAYRVKNLSDQPITAKAQHFDQPEKYVDFLNIIQCFCFIEQTLQPGEEMELPLVFRVEWDVPSEVKDFYVHYEFYPLESFPKE